MVDPVLRPLATTVSANVLPAASASRTAAPPPPPPVPQAIPPAPPTPPAQYTGQPQPPSATGTPTGVDFPVAGVIAGPGASKASLNAVRGLPGVQSAWAGKIAGNQQGKPDQEAAVIVPKGLDYSKEVKVLTYFHGWSGGIDKSLAPPAEGAFGPELMDWAKRNNAVIVMPQGPRKDAGLGKPDTWMSKPGQLAEFTQDALGQLANLLPPQARIGSIEIAGHSAGGVAVANALQGLADSGQTTLQGGRWQQVPIGAAHFLDASYSDQDDPKSSNRADTAYAALRRINPQAGFNLDYISQSMTDKKYSADPKGFEKTHPGLKLIPEPASVGHSGVPGHYFKNR